MVRTKGVRTERHQNSEINTMPEQEGVIKFQLDFTPAPALPADALLEISAWRKMLYLTQLIGQTPDRYDGLRLRQHQPPPAAI